MTIGEELLRTAFKYQDALLGYAFGVLRDWHLAEDVVQEAFIVLHNAEEGKFDSDANVYPWLKRVVRNKAVDVIRARSREKRFGDEDLLSLIGKQLEQYTSEEESLLLDCKRRALQKCMSKLADEALEVLMSFYRDRKSWQVLAEQYKKSANAIGLWLSRLRKQLRKCVKKTMPELEAVQ